MTSSRLGHLWKWLSEYCFFFLFDLIAVDLLACSNVSFWNPSEFQLLFCCNYQEHPKQSRWAFRGIKMVDGVPLCCTWNNHLWRCLFMSSISIHHFPFLQKNLFIFEKIHHSYTKLSLDLFWDKNNVTRIMKICGLIRSCFSVKWNSWRKTATRMIEGKLRLEKSLLIRKFYAIRGLVSWII